MKFKLDTANRDLFTAVTLLSGNHSVTDINYFTNIMKRVCGVELTKATLNMSQSSFFQLKEKYGIKISDEEFLQVKYVNVSQVPYILIGRVYKTDRDRVVNLLPSQIMIKRLTFISLYEMVYKEAIPINFMDYMIHKSGDRIKYKGVTDAYFPPIVAESHTRCAAMSNTEELRVYVRILHEHLLKSNEMDNDVKHEDLIAYISAENGNEDSVMFDQDSASDLFRTNLMDIATSTPNFASEWGSVIEKQALAADDIIQSTSAKMNNNMDVDEEVQEQIIPDVDNKMEILSHSASLEEGELYVNEMDTINSILDVCNRSPPTSERVDNSQGLSILTSDTSIQTLYALQQDKSDGLIDSNVKLTQHQLFVAEMFKVHYNNYGEFVSVYTHLKTKKLLF